MLREVQFIPEKAPRTGRVDTHPALHAFSRNRGLGWTARSTTFFWRAARGGARKRRGKLVQAIVCAKWEGEAHAGNSPMGIRKIGCLCCVTSASTNPSSRTYFQLRRHDWSKASSIQQDQNWKTFQFGSVRFFRRKVSCTLCHSPCLDSKRATSIILLLHYFTRQQRRAKLLLSFPRICTALKIDFLYKKIWF